MFDDYVSLLVLKQLISAPSGLIRAQTSQYLAGCFPTNHLLPSLMMFMMSSTYGNKSINKQWLPKQRLLLLVHVTDVTEPVVEDRKRIKHASLSFRTS